MVLMFQSLVIVTLLSQINAVPHRSPQLHIFGGTEVHPPFSYPWMTFLYLRSTGFGSQQGLCGGTLIDSETILTAAHCFTKPIPPSAIIAHIRRHNLSRTADEEDGDVVGIKAIHLHPDWNVRTLTNDVAVLKLVRPAQIHAVIGLDTGDTLRPGLVVRAMGWGLNSELRHTQTLQQVDLEVFSGEKCLTEYSKQLPTFDPRVAICVGTKGGGKNVCFGDSGGPLITITNKGPILVGTTSYGASCNPAIPAVFARIDVKESWISQLMKNEDENQEILEYGQDISALSTFYE